MTNTSPWLTLSSIAVEGLDPDMTRRAEEEIRTLLGPLERVDLDLAHDLELSVLVTADMAAQVDRIRQEHGTFTHPYRRERESGVAAGITLTASDGPPLRVTLVLDSGYWSRSDPLDIVQRVYMLGYVFGHALLQARETASDSTYTSDVPTVGADELRDVAVDLLDAFDADCTALFLCQSLRLDDGSSVQCSQWLGDDLIANASALADSLCVFAAIDIHFYRVTAVGLEELYPRAALLLGQTLQMLVHAFALYTADGRYDVAIDALKQSSGFQAYLQPDIDEFVAALKEGEQHLREERLAIVVERILGRLGLRLEDMPDGGIYVHVSDPVLCAMGDLSAS